MNRSFHNAITSVSMIGLLALITIAARPGRAQNPVDPAQSWVESNCNFVILTWPAAAESDFGDDGIIVHCYDAFGTPLEGIPGSAMTIVELAGPGAWPVDAVPTNAAGETMLTGSAGASCTLVHGVVGVNVHLDSEDVLLDNGGAGFVLELRTPDLDLNGIMNLNDVVLFGASFGCCEDTPQCLRADFTGDGCVDLADLVIFERYYGRSAGVAVGDARGGGRHDDGLFVGCIQLDFDDDGDPGTINEEVTALPFTPFALRFTAASFRYVSGADFEFGVPGDLVLLSRSPMPAFPLELPGTAAPGNERVIVSGDCATAGPLFVYEFTFMSPGGGIYHVDDFPIAHARFADCQYVPEVHDACIGSPTPCEVSYLEPGLEMFVSCPGGDLDTLDLVTVVMNDQEGQGVPGLPADEFLVLLADERGSPLANMVRFTPLALETDANGELPYRVELRESCRWDVCLDLFITVRYQSCDLHARKKIRTVNVVPAVSAGVQADAVVDLADVAWWLAHEYELDPCLALTSGYRCPVVSPGDIALVQAHLAHVCDFTGAPSLPRVARIAMHQNEPNPFNPRTEIRVDLPRAAPAATVCVYDVQGRIVATLHAGALPAGPSTFDWEGQDDGGRAVASGSYIACLRALGDVAAVRMLLLR